MSTSPTSSNRVVPLVDKDILSSMPAATGVPATGVPVQLIASREVGPRVNTEDEYNAGKRACLCLCCFPCVGWSVFFRCFCLPSDCMYGNACGGNGCTRMCDDACFFPVMFGKVIP